MTIARRIQIQEVPSDIERRFRRACRFGKRTEGRKLEKLNKAGYWRERSAIIARFEAASSADGRLQALEEFEALNRQHQHIISGRRR